MEPNRQTSLFDDPGPTEAAALVTIARPRAKPTPAQRTFNRLTGQIRQKRAVIEEWQGYTPRFQQRLTGELLPAIRQVRAAQRRLVEQMDRMLSGPPQGRRLTARQAGRLRSALLSMIDDILTEGPDAELETIHDRHGDLTLAEQRQLDMDMTEALLGEMFGEEAVRGHAANDVEELLRHAHERIIARAEAEERARASRRGARAKRDGRPSRAEQAAERKAQAEQEARLSVREIYRKLASGLHPDREADPLERERKTALMQRVNQAYERNDLLTLLTLQIEVEQIDAEHLAGVTAKRLEHYNHVLREQVRALDAEVQEQIDRHCGALSEQSWHGLTRPQDLDALLTERIEEARLTAADMDRDCAALADPARRRAVIDALPDDDDDDADLMDAALMQIFEDAAPAEPPVRRRGGGKRRKS